MRMRGRKRIRAKKPASYVARMKKSARAINTRTMFVAVLAVFGAAVLIGAATSNVPQDRPAAHVSTTVKPAVAANSPSTASAAETRIPPAGIPAAVPVSTSGARSGPVTTITGCLAREDAAYKLKDTAGDDAPKARSWKTGFLKKGHQPIELYDSSNRGKLPAHVGERVSVTGELIDREMYVRSVQRVSTSCATKS